MAANIDPIYSKLGDVSSDASTGMAPTFTTGSNTYDGTNANAKLVFTADATNGSYLQRIRFKALGTNVASVARVFLNNGSTNGTATNNSFYGEVSLPATTGSATVATIDIDYPMNLALNPGFRIYVLLGTTVAAGWVAVPVAGKY